MPDPLLDPPDWAPAWLDAHDPFGRRLLRWLTGGVIALGLGACVLRGADDPADPELGEPIEQFATTTTLAGDPGASLPDPGVDPGTTDPTATTVAPAGDAPADPGTTATTAAAPATTTAPTTPPPSGSGPTGASLAAEFGTMLTRILGAGGEVVELCLIHADQAAERGRGLMEVEDLSGYDGMLFSTSEETTNQFFMFNTPTPLTIAWYRGEGSFVSSEEMAPCAETDQANCERYAADGPWQHAIEVFQRSPAEDALVEGSRIELTGGACAP